MQCWKTDKASTKAWKHAIFLALIWIKETVFDGRKPAAGEPHSRQPARARAAAQCLRNKIGSECPPHKQNRFSESPSSLGKDAQAATALSAH
jgi:hypothetical protein